MDPCVLCGYPSCMDRKFCIVLPHDFETRTVCSLKYIYIQSTLFKLYMCNDNLLFSNDFTQNIPCNARRDFLEHVFRKIMTMDDTLRS